jgi:hypothetical protein
VEVAMAVDSIAEQLLPRHRAEKLWLCAIIHEKSVNTRIVREDRVKVSFIGNRSYRTSNQSDSVFSNFSVMVD